MNRTKPHIGAPYLPWFTKKKATFTYNRSVATLVINGKITDSERIHRSLLLLLENHFSENSLLTCYLHPGTLDAPTLRILFLLFRMFRSRQDLGCTITVFWAAIDDPDMAATCEDFSELFEVPIQFIPS